MKKLFDFFKKKPKIPKNLKIPKPTFITEQMPFDEYKKTVLAQSNDCFKVVMLKSKDKNNMFMVGRIYGYHPHPKDNIEKFMAIVNWPMNEKTKRSFIIDTTLLVKPHKDKKDHIIYPAEGTIVNFWHVGGEVETDNISREYGIAHTLSYNTFPPELRLD